MRERAFLDDSASYHTPIDIPYWIVPRGSRTERDVVGFPGQIVAGGSLALRTRTPIPHYVFFQYAPRPICVGDELGGRDVPY